MDSSQPNTPVPAQNPIASNLSDDNELDLRAMLDTLLEGRWLVAGVAAAVFTLGALYAWLATPIYKADALVQVEKQASAIPGLDDLSKSLGGGDGLAIAEIEIIKSRSVIGRVVENLGLDIQAAPRRFPLIGSAIARKYQPGEITRAWPGMRRYAWSGERIALGRLAVPAAFEGEQLRLITGEQGRFSLYDADNALLLQGEVGKAAKVVDRNGDVEIFVRELVANPGTNFILCKSPFDAVVQYLQRDLHVKERSKWSGILELTLEGDKREQVVAILNGIVNSYLRQNVERRSEEASRMLIFLDEQLPVLKKQLDAAETAMREYKSSRGAPVDISIEGEELLNRTTAIEQQISELELQRSELRQRYTEQHPAMATFNQKLNQLRQDRASIEQHFKGLPATEMQSIRLIRNVKVANELYVQLLNNAQELKVAKAGTVGNARVLDPAITPTEPVRPLKLRILSLALLLGVVLGVVVVFVRKALRRTLDNSDRIESQLGLPVYATIPHSRAQSSIDRAKPVSANANNHMLCRVAPQEPAVESLRSLRTSLQFALLQSRNNIVTIHGPTPGIGKSFVASNLAFLLADIGKRVLLVDADLRKGHVHGVFGVGRAPGLSDVIAGQTPLDKATHSFEDEKVCLLTTGTLPPNPSELLIHGNFSALVDQASRLYDFVIIDTPPTLNLADSIVIGKLSGTNFMVVRGGHNTLQDVQISNRRFQQNGIRIDGVIFNDLSVATSRYRYGGYYAYQYKTQG